MKLTRHLLMGMLAFALAYAPRAMAQGHNMHNMDQMQMNTAKATDRTAAAKSLDTTATAKVEYRCPMDMDIVSDKPGKCPKCGMALKKVTTQAASTEPMHHSTKQSAGSCCSGIKAADSVGVRQDHGNM